MTVRLLDDSGRSWARQTVVREGPSAYSNFATLPDGSLAIVFEGGASSPCEGIVFKELPYDQIETGRTGHSAARRVAPLSHRHSPGPPIR
jgi:hypothetical protein